MFFIKILVSVSYLYCIAALFVSKLVAMMFSRPPDKSGYWKFIFFISHPKHMLWVLKRTVSLRRFF